MPVVRSSMRRPIVTLLVLAVAVGLVLYLVQRDQGRASAPSGARSGPSAEMVGAMHRMHEAASRIEMTGDIDRDFVALMIPHHQSAVEMARAYLRSGRDPGLRRLSENIIASQEAEIRLMRGRKPAPAGDSHAGH